MNALKLLTPVLLTELDSRFNSIVSFPKRTTSNKPWFIDVVVSDKVIMADQYNMSFNIHQDQTTGEFDFRLLGNKNMLLGHDNRFSTDVIIAYGKKLALDELLKLKYSQEKLLEAWKEFYSLLESKRTVLTGSDNEHTILSVIKETKKLFRLVSEKMKYHETMQRGLRWIPWLDYITEYEYGIKIRMDHQMFLTLKPFEQQLVTMKVNLFIEFDRKDNCLIGCLSEPFRHTKTQKMEEFVELLGKHKTEWSIEE